MSGRAALRLGANDTQAASAATVVHSAGIILNRYVDLCVVQRCRRCGRVLARVTARELADHKPGSAGQRQLLRARFFPEGRLIAEGPTSTYLVTNRALAADETECEFVPAFAWE